jgi:hypothetical protein
MGDEISIREITKDGRYILRTFSQEMRMSHWVDRPQITDRHNCVLFSLDDACYDLRSWNYENDCWELTLFAYPDGTNAIRIRLDFRHHSGSINGVAYSSISDVEQALRLR